MSGTLIPHPLNNFSSDQVASLILTNQIVSAFSILSCVIVMTIYWYFKEIRSFILELIIWLCISEVFYNLTAYFEYSNIREEKPNWCALQAFMIVTFQNTTWIWSCVIGYCAFISVIKRQHLEKHKRAYRRAFVVVSFFLSAFLALMYNVL
jgi:phosphoglycerol transferase MdoB-like AlkP superfamily enzyme